MKPTDESSLAKASTNNMGSFIKFSSVTHALADSNQHASPKKAHGSRQLRHSNTFANNHYGSESDNEDDNNNGGTTQGYCGPPERRRRSTLNTKPYSESYGDHGSTGENKTRRSAPLRDMQNHQRSSNLKHSENRNARNLKAVVFSSSTTSNKNQSQNTNSSANSNDKYHGPIVTNSGRSYSSRSFGRQVYGKQDIKVRQHQAVEVASSGSSPVPVDNSIKTRYQGPSADFGDSISPLGFHQSPSCNPQGRKVFLLGRALRDSAALDKASIFRIKNNGNSSDKITVPQKGGASSYMPLGGNANDAKTGFTPPPIEDNDKYPNWHQPLASPKVTPKPLAPLREVEEDLLSGSFDLSPTSRISVSPISSRTKARYGPDLLAKLRGNSEESPSAAGKMGTTQLSPRTDGAVVHKEDRRPRFGPRVSETWRGWFGNSPLMSGGQDTSTPNSIRSQEQSLTPLPLTSVKIKKEPAVEQPATGENHAAKSLALLKMSKETKKPSLKKKATKAPHATKRDVLVYQSMADLEEQPRNKKHRGFAHYQGSMERMEHCIDDFCDDIQQSVLTFRHDMKMAMGFVPDKQHAMAHQQASATKKHQAAAASSTKVTTTNTEIEK